MSISPHIISAGESGRGEMVHSLSITNILPARVKEEPGGDQLSSAKIIMVFFKTTVTEKDKLMSLWQVDICWLVAFLRLSILYLHPYHLPSLSELLNLEQFLHSVYRVGLWSVKIMVIQTKTTVGSVFASDDGRVL